VAELPAGIEPAIQPVSPDTPPPAAAKPVAVEGARALQQEESAPPRPAGKGGFGIDPGGVLRGIFGR
jgi:hypothetical protein